MPEITTSRDLFLHELGDILYVEQKLAEEVLPTLMEEVDDAELRKGFEKHLRETERHVTNLEQAFEKLGEEPETEECIGFDGLKSEHDQLVLESAPQLIDLVDAGAAARTEHYEIAAYESLIAMARGLGERDVIELFEKNLKDEKETLREVESVAKRLAKEHAKEESAA
jgi:ferritin-like metal-binding protein YciE